MSAKMSPRCRLRVEAAAWIVVAVLSAAATTARGEPRGARCPIGFELTRVAGRDTCYRLKGPESFDDKYVGCAGNAYSSQLLRRAEFAPREVRLWADYVNLYAGGPLVDWSAGESTGDVLRTTFDVPLGGADGDLCTVLEPRTLNVSAVACDGRHYRYCFVPPYERAERAGCGEGYVRARRPRPACLQAVSAVRATWRQARAMCARRGGRLLQRGWRYSNHPTLRAASASAAAAAAEAGEAAAAEWMAPLGVVMNRGDGLRWLDPVEGETDLVTESEWNFPPEEQFAAGSELVALAGDAWRMVNDSHVFYEVLCEQPVSLPAVTMNLTLTAEGRLQLNVSERSLREDDVWCFTDADTFFPTDDDVKVSRIGHDPAFRIRPDGNGYCWCFVSDFTRYLPSRSNRQLYIGDKQAVVNQYAIKLQVDSDYSFKTLEKMRDRLWEKLSEDIYAWSKYVQIYGDNVPTENLTERVLAEFGGKRKLELSKDDVVYDLKLKRVYLDRRSLLFHAHINTVMFPLVAGLWNDTVLLSMRPVYFCQAFDGVPMMPLGEQITLDGCRSYSCVGDFNEGVQWVESVGPRCTTPPPASLSTRALHSSIAVNVTANYRDGEYKQENMTTEPTTEFLTIIDESDSEEEEASTTTTVVIDDYTTPVTTATAAGVLGPRPPPATTPPTTVTEYPSTATMPPSTIPPITTPSPGQLVMDVMAELEAMVHEEGTLSLQQMTIAAERMDELLELQDDDAEIPGQLLHLMDEVGARMELNGSQSLAVVRDNIGVVAADSLPGAPVRGLRLAYSGRDELTEDAFHIITGDVSDAYLDWNASEVVVNLPESLVDLEKRVTFIVFRNNRAFQTPPSPLEPRVNSRVLSVTVSNLTSFQDGDFVDIHLRPIDHEVPRDARRACAYWNFNADDTGFWSQEGCTFIPSNGIDTLDVCRCTHLTHFAEILAPRSVFSEANETALEVISIVGCLLSMIGLLLVALTAALFRSWRRDFSNKIWLQLSAAIFLLAVSFLVVAFSDFDRYTVLCMLSGVLLHYATLASFCWMLVAAVLSYRRLVLVFTRDASHKLLRACGFAWGAPCFVIGVLLAISPSGYSNRFVDSANTSFCYPTGLGLWLAVYAPIASALLANWTLFALIVRSVFASRRIKRHGDSGEALRCATVSFLLVFLFGLPWVFGLFATLLPFAYLFVLTATYQGFVLFLFFVVGNKKTRDLWLNKLKIRQMRSVPVTSSSYKSSGRGATNGAASAAPATLEEVNVKPRSLTGRDDISRFS